MRRKLSTPTLMPDPAGRDRFINRVTRDRGDQYSKTHLIRTNHHAIAHARHQNRISRPQTAATPEPLEPNMINLS
jgi:hypothetical protein